MTPDKPICKVHGMLAPNAICGHIIVGMKHCGFSGDCQHKSAAGVILKMVKNTVKEQE